MALRRRFSRFWQGLFQRTRLDRELDEELYTYLDDLIEKKIRAGQDPVAARRQAMLEMGGMAQVRAEVQRVRMGAGFDALWHDIRYNCRCFFRKPAFAVVAVVTFALGVGANTAIFSVVNNILIQPLPYKDSSQLAFVWGDATAIGYPRGPLSGPELKDLRDRGTLFSAFGAIWANTATITSDRDPEQLRIGFVTANFFDTLGAVPQIGRTFNNSESIDSASPAILLSWALWQRRYGGDASIVGTTIIVNGRPTLVAGVMPEDFRLIFPPDSSVPEDLEAWLPFWSDYTEGPRRQNFLRIVGRMKPGVQLAQAHDQVSQIAARISGEYTEYGRAGRAMNLVGLQSESAREIRPGLLALLGGVGILVITACLNVASLLVARAVSRTKETALRLAIGAGYPQIVRQFLVEGLILACVGCVVGVLFGEKLEPQTPIYDIRPMEEYLAGARSVQRFTMILAASFAAVALVLAFVGVYGLVTYSVNTRRYEFGVRLALGAKSGQILRLVIREGVLLLTAGLLVGVAVAAAVAHLIEAQLYGVTALDLPTYAIALAVIAAAGLLASWLPARRASVSNPLEVMRVE